MSDLLIWQLGRSACCALNGGWEPFGAPGERRKQEENPVGQTHSVLCHLMVIL